MNALNIETESTPFYKVGGTLLPNAPSYVVRKADSELLDTLRKGEYCYVLDSRQVGKSSLINHVAHILKEKDGVRVVKLDLTEYGGSDSLERWLYTLLKNLGRQIRLAEELIACWRALTDDTPAFRFMEAIRNVAFSKVNSPLVIFIDEIDFVRSLSFDPDDLFAAIRAEYNRNAKTSELYQLTFCLVGSTTPGRLIRNPEITPFNVGKGIELDDFTDTEAASFAKGFGDKSNAKRLLDRVLYWTNGHPYLTQFFCQAVAEANVNSPADVDKLAESLFFAPKPREDKNLPNVVEKLKGSGENMDTLLSLYGQVRSGRRICYADKASLHAALKLSGLLRDRDGWLRVRNRIYARVFDRAWIRANMSNAAMLAAQEAYRKGILRATAISLPIIALILVLAGMAVHNANLANKAITDRAISDAQAKTEKAKAEVEHDKRISADQLAAQKTTSLKEIDKAKDKTDAANRELKRTVGKLHKSNANLNIATRRANQNEKLAEQATDKERIAHAEAARLRYDADMGLVMRAYDNRDFKTIRNLLAEERNFKEHGFEWAYWNHIMGLKRLTLPNQLGEIRSALFTPNGKRVICYTNELGLAAWDVKTHKEAQTFFRADGTIIVWNAQTGKKVFTGQGEMYSLNAVAFSPDSQRIAYSRQHSKVEVWQIHPRRKITDFYGIYLTAHHSIAFSPDGRQITTVGDPAVQDSTTGKEIFRR